MPLNNLISNNDINEQQRITLKLDDSLNAARSLVDLHGYQSILPDDGWRRKESIDNLLISKNLKASSDEMDLNASIQLKYMFYFKKKKINKKLHFYLNYF